MVTILILIDGFLQYQRKSKMNKYPSSHNPYFNRWFSAIDFQMTKCPKKYVTILILIDGFLQSVRDTADTILDRMVTILILIDGFLQLKNDKTALLSLVDVTILILIDGFLQYKL